MKGKTKLKATYSLFVSLIILVCCFSFASINLVTAQAKSSSITLSGDGSEASPYLIGSLEELEFFRDDVNGGNTYEGKYIKLTDNIDLSSIEDWTPIGNQTNKFQGYFNGNDKTISNLTVLGGNDYVGFFGYINGNGMSATTIPSVKDLTLSNVSVSGGYRVGGLAGQGYTCNVTGVTVSGEVSGVRYVGGFIGHVYTYFSDCHFNGAASCSFDALGGLAGAGDGRFYNCSVIGTVSGSNWVGGVIGNGQEGMSAVGCYVKATVSTNSNWYFGVGGIAGVGGHGYTNSKFENNYFDGEVFLEGQKVNAIVIGIINANNNESIGTSVSGNSWNTEYYDATTPVLIVAEVSSNATPEEWVAGANENLTTTRNNNLVVLPSDIKYVDATNINEVTIMDVSKFNSNLTSVQPEQLTEQIAENNLVAFIDDNKNLIKDKGEKAFNTLQETVNNALIGDAVILLKDTLEMVYIKAGILFNKNNFNAPNVTVEELKIADIKVSRNETEKSTTVTITYTNCEKVTAFTVYDGQNGTNGINGTNGLNGIDGVNGTNGKDGIGIKTVEINENGELVITYDNDSKANLGVIVGKNGKDGINGVDGVNGTNGKDAGNGLAITAIIVSGLAIFLIFLLVILFFFKGSGA